MYKIINNQKILRPHISQIHTLPVEKSVGAILVTDDDKILIVRGVNGKWGFPKGHVEDDEVELVTMLREVKEETDINVSGVVIGRIEESFILHHSTYRINIYIAAGKDPYRWEPCYVNRLNVYFIIRHKECRFKLQEDEIIDAKWVSINNAKEIFTENNSSYFRILGKVSEYVNSPKNRSLVF